VKRDECQLAHDSLRGCVRSDKEGEATNNMRRQGLLRGKESAHVNPDC